MKKKNYLKLLRTACFAMAALLCVSASAADYYVKPSGAGNLDGSDWDNAFATIEAGVNAATTAGDVVRVMKGVYPSTSGVNNITVNITLEGGYTGEGLEREIDPTNTVWSDGTTSPNRPLGGSFTSTVKISGITFANLSFTGSGAFYSFFQIGGNNAINIATPGIVTFEDCIFRNLTHSSSGAGYGGLFRLNHASSRLFLTRCTIDNVSTTGNSTVGSVVFFNTASSQATIENCVIKNCSSKTNIIGGTVSSTLTIRNSFFIDNTSGSTTGNNVLIHRSTGTTSIFNCLFAGNNSGLNLAGGTRTVRNNIFYGTATTAAPSNPALGTNNGNNQTVSAGNIGDYFDADWRQKHHTNTYNKGSDAGLSATVDFAGGARIQDGTVDIGPYELIKIKTIDAGAGATIVSATLNGEDVSLTEEFHAIYGDVLEIAFTKDNAIAACNIPEATIEATGDDCVATIKITEPLADIEVSSVATLRTVTVGTLPTSCISAVSTVGTGSPYSVPDGTTFLLTITNQEGYVPTANMGTMTDNDDWTYTLAIENVTENIAVSFTNAIKTYALNVNQEACINLTEPAPATIEHGDNYTLSFTLASGYHRPLVAVNGVQQTLTNTEGTYSITLSSVKEAKNVILVAWSDDEIPVMYDGYANSAGYMTEDKIVAGNNGTNRLGLVKFDLSDIDLTQCEKMELKLTVKDVGTAISSNDFRLSWRSNYLSANTSSSSRNDTQESPNLWTESNLNWNGTSATSNRPATKEGFDPVDATVTQETTTVSYSIEGANVTLLKTFIEGAVTENKALSFMIADAATAVSNRYFEIYSREGALVAGDKSLYPVLKLTIDPDTETRIKDNTIDESIIVSTKYYTLQGIEIVEPIKGNMYVVKKIYQSGKSDSKVTYFSK